MGKKNIFEELVGRCQKTPDMFVGSEELPKKGQVIYESKTIHSPESMAQELLQKQKPTLRDQFAMAALTGMLANPVIQEKVSQGNFSLALHHYHAKAAYTFADEMLKQREKKEDEK